jgi:hypothetical protein
MLAEPRERLQRGENALLGNQSASLHQLPTASRGRHPAHERELVQRHARAIEGQPFRRAAEFQQSAPQRLRTRQDQRDRLKHLAELRLVADLALAQRDIGAVERDNTGFIPGLDKREQMHTGMPEIDVHELGLAPPQDAIEQLELAAINHRLGTPDILEVKPAQEILGWLADQFHIVEGIALGVLPGLRHDERLIRAQPRHLTVDVRHFPLEERGAIAGDDGWRGRVQESRCFSRSGAPLSIKMRDACRGGFTPSPARRPAAQATL